MITNFIVFASLIHQVEELSYVKNSTIRHLQVKLRLDFAKFGSKIGRCEILLVDDIELNL